MAKDTHESPRRKSLRSSISHGEVASPSADGRKGFLSFPQKLYNIIEDDKFSDSIWWNENGTSFYLRSASFTENVIRDHFQGTKFESFTRKLNRWGFSKKVDKANSEIILYNHPSFCKGKQTELKKMSLCRSAKKKRKTRDEILLEEEKQLAAPIQLRPSLDSKSGMRAPTRDVQRTAGANTSPSLQQLLRMNPQNSIPAAGLGELSNLSTSDLLRESLRARAGVSTGQQQLANQMAVNRRLQQLREQSVAAASRLREIRRIQGGPSEFLTSSLGSGSLGVSSRFGAMGSLGTEASVMDPVRRLRRLEELQHQRRLAAAARNDMELRMLRRQLPRNGLGVSVLGTAGLSSTLGLVEANTLDNEIMVRRILERERLRDSLL